MKKKLSLDHRRQLHGGGISAMGHLIKYVDGLADELTRLNLEIDELKHNERHLQTRLDNNNPGKKRRG
jgi:hypothetical protein